MPERSSHALISSRYGRVLHRVSKQVENDLSQMCRIRSALAASWHSGKRKIKTLLRNQRLDFTRNIENERAADRSAPSVPRDGPPPSWPDPVSDQRDAEGGSLMPRFAARAACFGVSSPYTPSRNRSTNPTIALSGVRSSCETFARNSLFILLTRINSVDRCSSSLERSCSRCACIRKRRTTRTKTIAPTPTRTQPRPAGSII